MAINNGKPKRKRTKLLHTKILQQMEFYFSDSSLTRDKFLRSCITDNKYIPISVFLTFNKIKCLTGNVEDVVGAVRKSHFLQLSDDALSVCRRHPFSVKHSAESCTIYVEGVPFHSTEETIRRTFSVYGTIDRVSLPINRHTGLMHGFCFVEFRTPDMAFNALQAFGALGRRIPSERYPECGAAEASAVEPEASGATESARAVSRIKRSLSGDTGGAAAADAPPAKVTRFAETLAATGSTVSSADDPDYLPGEWPSTAPVVLLQPGHDCLNRRQVTDHISSLGLDTSTTTERTNSAQEHSSVGNTATTTNTSTQSSSSPSSSTSSATASSSSTSSVSSSTTTTVVEDSVTTDSGVMKTPRQYCPRAAPAAAAVLSIDVVPHSPPLNHQHSSNDDQCDMLSDGDRAGHNFALPASQQQQQPVTSTAPRDDRDHDGDSKDYETVVPLPTITDSSSHNQILPHDHHQQQEEKRRRPARRSRRRWPMFTEEDSDMLQLQIMPLAEWLRFRHQYRALQKQHFGAVKQSLRQSAAPTSSCCLKTVDSGSSVCSDGGTGGRRDGVRNTYQYSAGCIVKLTPPSTSVSSSAATTAAAAAVSSGRGGGGAAAARARKSLLRFRRVAGVVYVDVDPSTGQVTHLRFDSSSAALSALSHPTLCHCAPHVLSGADEADYWRHLQEARQTVRAGTQRQPLLRGKDKLLRRLWRTTAAQLSLCQDRDFMSPT